MEQVHKQFSIEQVKLLLQRYGEGHMSREELQEILGIRKTRFFALWKEYRQSPDAFSVTYERNSPRRLSGEVEQEIEDELKREKELVDDPRLPISNYNYSALRDRPQKKAIRVSLPTIIERAKRLECYKAPRKHKVHDRAVVTTAIGALIQQDASLQQCSPSAQEKWTLLTSIDDYSRMLLKVDVTYALCPQAKGKVERHYRWLQDRIVRTCAWEHLAQLEELRPVLRQEVHRYNYQQVHSTTRQIPYLRFEQARKAGNSLFRLFSLPKPYSSPKDVFCLHSVRRVDGYRKISFMNQQIEVSHIPLREEVELHPIPDPDRQNVEIRICYQHNMVRALHCPLPDTPVHL